MLPDFSRLTIGTATLGGSSEGDQSEDPSQKFLELYADFEAEQEEREAPNPNPNPKPKGAAYGNLDPTAADIPQLVDLVRNGTETQKRNAANRLGILAVGDDANRKAIGNAGGLPPLVALVTNGTDEQKEIAAAALWNLAARNDANSKAIADAGGIPPLVALVRKGTEQQQTNASGALWFLACSDDMNAAIVAARGIRPLVALKRYGTETQKRNATNALRNLAIDNKAKADVDAMRVANDTSSLVALVRDGTEQQKVYAANALYTLAAGNDTNQATIVAAGGLPPLVALARDGTKEQKDNAALALCMLALNYTNRAAIAAAGGIRPLVALVRNGTDEQKKRAADALGSLATDNAANQVAIGAAGGIPPLVAMIRNGTIEQGLKAAGALSILSLDRVNCSVISDKGGIPLLLRMVSWGDQQEKEYALIVLANITAYDYLYIDEDIKTKYSIPKLVAFIRHGTSEQKQRAASVLGNFAYESEYYQDAIEEEGGIRPLVALVRNGTEQQKENAARAFRNLSYKMDNEHDNAIWYARAIRPLVALVRDGTGKQKEYAAGALANFASYHDPALNITSAGGIPPLVALVRNGTEEQKKSAAEALQNLAGDSDATNKVAIVTAGGIPPLVALMVNGTQNQKGLEAMVHAAMALVSLVDRNLGNQVAVVDAGGVPPLVALLQKGLQLHNDVYAGALQSIAGSNTANRLLVDATMYKLGVARWSPCNYWKDPLPKFAEVRDAMQKHGEIYDFLVSAAELLGRCKSHGVPESSPKTLARMLLNLKILGAAATAKSNPSALAAKSLFKVLAIEIDEATKSGFSQPVGSAEEAMDTPEFRAMENMENEYNNEALEAKLKALGLDEFEIQQAQRFERWLAIAGVIARTFNAAADGGNAEAKEVMELAEAFVSRLTAPPVPGRPSPLLFKIGELELTLDDQAEGGGAEPSAKRLRTAAQISASLATFFGHETVARLKLRAEDLHPLLVARYGHS